MKILMVCLGNICRSPLAEGILKHKIRSKGLNWTVDSAGIGHWHIGSQPDQRSIDVAQKHGIDITDQRGRQFSKKDLENYDLILAMDSSNYGDIIRLAADEQEKKKVKLIMNLSSPESNQDVPDPYYNDNGFEGVYMMLEEAIDALIESKKISVS